MYVHTETYTHKLLELIHEFSKVQDKNQHQKPKISFISIYYQNPHGVFLEIEKLMKSYGISRDPK